MTQHTPQPGRPPSQQRRAQSQREGSMSSAITGSFSPSMPIYFHQSHWSNLSLPKKFNSYIHQPVPSSWAFYRNGYGNFHHNFSLLFFKTKTLRKVWHWRYWRTSLYSPQLWFCQHGQPDMEARRLWSLVSVAVSAYWSPCWCVSWCKRFDLAPSDEGCDGDHCHWDSYRRFPKIQIHLVSTFFRFNNLKQRNPRLKTLLSIGGWNSGSGMWSEVSLMVNSDWKWHWRNRLRKMHLFSRAIKDIVCYWMMMTRWTTLSV